MHDVTSQADNDRPRLCWHVVNSISGQSQLRTCLQVLAVSMHNPNLLYKLDQSRMDLGCAVQEQASDECFRRLVVKTHTCCNSCCEACPPQKA